MFIICVIFIGISHGIKSATSHVSTFRLSLSVTTVDLELSAGTNTILADCGRSYAEVGK